MSLRRITLLAFALLCAAPAPLLRAQPSPPAVHVPTALLDTYTGQYRDQKEPDDILSVFRDGDRLYIEGPRTPRIDLTAESTTSFKPSFDAHYIFLADPPAASPASTSPVPKTTSSIRSPPSPSPTTSAPTPVRTS